MTEAIELFPKDLMLNGGLVDYVLGAEPGPGVFVIGYNDDPIKQQYANYFKMGDGPFYVFYVPYHLPHLEVPITVARAVLFRDAAVAPLGAPVCDVVAVAKHDLKRGQIVDGIGGFDCYGVLENSNIVRDDRLLPMGLVEGCRLTRDISQDEIITCVDIELPAGRLCDQLRDEQNAIFAS